MIDERWHMLNGTRLGEPSLSFAAGTTVEDIVRAIAARAELETTIVRAGAQRTSETFGVHAERSVAEALDLVRFTFGWEWYLDPRGTLVCVGTDHM